MPYFIDSKSERKIDFSISLFLLLSPQVILFQLSKNLYISIKISANAYSIDLPIIASYYIREGKENQENTIDNGNECGLNEKSKLVIFYIITTYLGWFGGGGVSGGW